MESEILHLSISMARHGGEQSFGIESLTWRRREGNESSQSVKQKEKKEKEPRNNKAHVS